LTPQWRDPRISPLQLLVLFNTAKTPGCPILAAALSPLGWETKEARLGDFPAKNLVKPLKTHLIDSKYSRKIVERGGNPCRNPVRAHTTVLDSF